MSLYRIFPRKYSKSHEAPQARHKETEALADFRFLFSSFGEQINDLPPRPFQVKDAKNSPAVITGSCDEEKSLPFRVMMTSALARMAV